MTTSSAPAITPRSALIALLIVVPAPSIGALVAFWIAPGPAGLIAYGIGKCILYMTPALWRRFVDRERWTLSKPTHNGWLIGLVSGLVIGASIIATYALLGERAIDIELFKSLLAKNGLGEPLKFVVAAAWFALGNSLLEEYAFRWFITRRLEALAPRAAVALSALCFTLHHIVVLAAYLPVATTVLACSGIFAGGLLWSWLYRRSRSIWPGWLSHAIVDIAIMAIGWRVLFG